MGVVTECIDNVCVPVQEVDLQFGCLDDPIRELISGETGTAEIILMSLGDNQPVPGIQISQCNSLFDRGCESPVATAVSDADGRVTLPIPPGFRGHLFTEGQNGLARELFYFFPPPDPERPVTLSIPFFVANLAQVVAAGAVIGVAMVPDTAVVFFRAEDCQGEPLTDVVLSVSPSIDESQPVYLSPTDLPDSTLSATGATGRGALVNIPVGNATITAVHKDHGVIFEKTIIADANSIISIRVMPSM